MFGSYSFIGLAGTRFFVGEFLGGLKGSVCVRDS